MSSAASVVVKPLVRPGELLLEASDLGLLGDEFADLRAGLLTVENPGVALLAPLADQRRGKAFTAQIRPTFVHLARLLVGGQVGELIGGAEHGPAGTVGSGMSGGHAVIVLDRDRGGNRHRRVDPYLAPAGGVAVNQWSQLC